MVRFQVDGWRSVQCAGCAGGGFINDQISYWTRRSALLCEVTGLCRHLLSSVTFRNTHTPWMERVENRKQWESRVN